MYIVPGTLNDLSGGSGLFGFIFSFFIFSSEHILLGIQVRSARLACHERCRRIGLSLIRVISQARVMEAVSFRRMLLLAGNAGSSKVSYYPKRHFAQRSSTCCAPEGTLTWGKILSISREVAEMASALQSFRARAPNRETAHSVRLHIIPNPVCGKAVQFFKALPAANCLRHAI